MNANEMLLEETRKRVTREVQLPDGGVVWSVLEESFIRQALLRSEGSLSKASRLLGITYKTLQYRLRKYNIDRQEYA